MESKVYKYMDWPEIEAVVYAEEAPPFSFISYL